MNTFLLLFVTPSLPLILITPREMLRKTMGAQRGDGLNEFRLSILNEEEVKNQPFGVRLSRSLGLTSTRAARMSSSASSSLPKGSPKSRAEGFRGDAALRSTQGREPCRRKQTFCLYYRKEFEGSKYQIFPLRRVGIFSMMSVAIKDFSPISWAPSSPAIPWR